MGVREGRGRKGEKIREKDGGRKGEGGREGEVSEGKEEGHFEHVPHHVLRHTHGGPLHHIPRLLFKDNARFLFFDDNAIDENAVHVDRVSDHDGTFGHGKDELRM